MSLRVQSCTPCPVFVVRVPGKIAWCSLSTIRERQTLRASGFSLTNMQKRVYDSYWRVARGDGENAAAESSDYGDCFEKMLRLKIADLRRLMHPLASGAQGTHPAEASERCVSHL